MQRHCPLLRDGVVASGVPVHRLLREVARYAGQLGRRVNPRPRLARSPAAE